MDDDEGAGTATKKWKWSRCRRDVSGDRGALAVRVDDENAGTATKKWDKHGAVEMYLTTVARKQPAWMMRMLGTATRK